MAVTVASALVGFSGRGLAADSGPGAALSDSAIFDNPSGRLRFRIESISTRVSAYDQFGTGYQSQAGPTTLGPGSERATILEPQAEVVASQGKRLEHRFWVPIDVVTAASPDAVDKTRPDVVSGASRKNVAGTFDWQATYKLDRDTHVGLLGGLHLEEPFRSWHGGMSFSRAFEDGGTVLSGNVLAVFDWFDHFDIQGYRGGRTNRSNTTASLSVTRIVTPTTLLNASYGLTVQAGELGNTWNSVPLADGKRGPELLPSRRLRHVLVVRASQFLPWNGAIHVYYRFYRDDWGIVASSAEAELRQRLWPFLYVGFDYRFHTQTGARFFTTLSPLDAEYRTADSDLASLDADTFGGRVVVDLPVNAEMHALHFDLGYERYVRTNDLRVNVVTWATGYRF